jgi:branched-chain amino acid transport system substrate-binding protein
MRTSSGFRALVSVVLVVALCAGMTVPVASAEDVIKFGAAVSLTGGLAREGNSTRDAYEFWKDRVNGLGGIAVGGKKYKVDITYYDDKSDTTVAAKLIEKLITTDDVKFLLGPFGSGSTFSASSVAEKYHVPMIAPSATADRIYERGYKYLFGTMGSTKVSWEPFFAMLESLPKRPETIAILTENTIFPSSQAQAAKASAEKHGLKVVFYSEFPRGLNDYSSMLARVKSLQPDVLIATGFINDNIQMTKQLKELSVTAPIIALSSGPLFKDFTAALGPDANGIITVDFWAPDMPYKGPVFGSAAEFTRAWESKYKYAPWSTLAATVLAGLAFQLAIEKANSLEPEKVTAALHELNTDTYYGRLKFNELGMNVPANPVRQIQNEQLTTVWPKEGAAAKLVYPFPAWKR